MLNQVTFCLYTPVTASMLLDAIMYEFNVFNVELKEGNTVVLSLDVECEKDRLLTNIMCFTNKFELLVDPETYKAFEVLTKVNTKVHFRYEDSSHFYVTAENDITW